jgi:hypothetical protein
MTHISISDCTVKYWLTEGGRAVAEVRSGHRLILMTCRPESVIHSWEVMETNSPEWNWLHQHLFRNYRADPIPPEDVVALPPLPTTVEVGPARSSESFVIPDAPIPVHRFYQLARVVKDWGGDGLQISVLLREDRYESLHGDGRFHDFVDVCLSAEEVKIRTAEIENDDNACAHVRQMHIVVRDGFVQIPDFRHEMFDTESALQILVALEQRLLRTT